MFNSACGISRISLIYKINSLKGRTSLAAVDKAMYSASVVLRVISVWSLDNQVIGLPPYLMTHPVLDLTELGSSQVSLG